jgi:methyltransferase-like protein/trans-aconitate methyltransferase
MNVRAETAFTTYDEVPYEGGAFAQSHPQRLRALGHVFGLESADISRCRVLELGCAFGGNLIPMAVEFPDSEFVGVDLSLRQIEGAQTAIRELGLRNIRLEHASILDVDASWGTFDYVICHGVFSWVSPEVRDGILRVSSDNLTPRGIAYVSYNTYPGWRMREMIRDMMLYHADRFAETRSRIEQARALLEFLSDSVPAENNCYGMLLRREVDLVRRSEDWYLFHDHMETVNAPVYFHQFIEQAAGHGLQYLAESDFGTMLNAAFPPGIRETLKRISQDIIHDEQYMDFLRNRMFRQTLLCHQGITLDRQIHAGCLDGLFLASAAEPADHPVDLSTARPVTFRSPGGLSIRCDNSLTQAALVVLRAHWPRALGLLEIRREARQRLGSAGNNPPAQDGGDIEELSQDLLRCCTVNVVEMRSWQGNFVTTVSSAPAVRAWARYQASRSCFVTSALHEPVQLDVLSRQLLKVLDGTRGHDELVDHLVECVRKEWLEIKKNGQPIQDPGELREALATAMHGALERLAGKGVLVA